ncbi:hypothetical protein GBA52_014796 [Prunus armeniaca]|nr:hypothetical protein GBA52_014796 [Prunus armeniaca]
MPSIFLKVVEILQQRGTKEDALYFTTPNAKEVVRTSTKMIEMLDSLFVD